MKQETKQKLFFVAGVVFGLALLGASVGIIAAETGRTWSPPSGPFPEGNVYPPLDTGPGMQTKTGSIILEGKDKNGELLRYPKLVITKVNEADVGPKIQLEVGQSISDSNRIGSYTPVGIMNNSVIFSQNAVIMNSKGFVIPKAEDTTGMNPVPGMIYFDTTKNKIQLRDNEKWTDIGGGGGGDSYWVRVPEGIAYYGGNVVISPKYAWVYTGKDLPVNTNRSVPTSLFSINSAHAEGEGVNLYEIQRMTCDKSDIYNDCPDTKYTGDGNLGDLRYDVYNNITLSCTKKNYKLTTVGLDKKCCLTPDNGAPNPDYCEDPIQEQGTKTLAKQFKYTTTDGMVGYFSAGDVNLTAPKYSGSTGELENRGKEQEMNLCYDERTVSCPDGYFVSSIRFGRTSGSCIYPVIKCSKL